LWGCRSARYVTLFEGIYTLNFRGNGTYRTFAKIIANVIVQLIILLYLLDNNADTSWMIVFGQGMGMLIEAWKVTKALDISIVQSPPGSRIPYKLEIKGQYTPLFFFSGLSDP
jgi:hypothetical protein